MEKASKWLLADSSRKVKEALAQFGVPYGTFWLYHERQVLLATGTTVHTQAEIAKHGGYDGAWFSNQVHAYHEAGLSWGSIMVRFDEANPFGVSEAKVRKGFERKANVQSEGLRTGKGGRFFGGVEFAPYIYRSELDTEPNRKAMGTAIEPGSDLAAKAAEIAALRAEAQGKAKRQPKRPAKAS
jgi:hypothetical protein